jgi:hypothetical protein
MANFFRRGAWGWDGAQIVSTKLIGRYDPLMFFYEIPHIS